jgi:hypothetical protein
MADKSIVGEKMGRNTYTFSATKKKNQFCHLVLVGHQVPLRRKLN